MTIDDVWRDHRAYVVDLAFRMLGNIQGGEDVVQEAFTRLLRADLEEIEEVRGWLIVVVSRLCLDQLGSARARTGGERGGDRGPRVVLDDPGRRPGGPGHAR